MLRSRFVYNKIMQSSSSAPHDFNSCAAHDSATVAYLLAKRRTAGGFDWTFADVKAAQGLVARGIQLPFGAFINADAPLPPRSVFNMATEDYVKRTILETFGVLSQVKIVRHDKFGNLQWLMTGVCPLHRHHHESQHWYISDTKNADTIVGCFFLLPNGKQPRAFVPHIPLIARGDSRDHYPVPHDAPPPLE